MPVGAHVTAIVYIVSAGRVTINYMSGYNTAKFRSLSGVNFAVFRMSHQNRKVKHPFAEKLGAQLLPLGY